MWIFLLEEFIGLITPKLNPFNGNLKICEVFCSNMLIRCEFISDTAWQALCFFRLWDFVSPKSPRPSLWNEYTIQTNKLSVLASQDLVLLLFLQCCCSQIRLACPVCHQHLKADGLFYFPQFVSQTRAQLTTDGFHGSQCNGEFIKLNFTD